jgi:hypothetical protein
MSAEGTAVASPSPTMAGPSEVTLEQYAGVTAALADGFPLGAILDNEGLAPHAWRAAEIAWKARVARDGAGGPLFTEMCTKRGVAEDCLARGVAPLDADLGAWLAFLRAFGEHRAPFDLLAGAGLGMNDVSRLQRRWARRMAEDAELRKQAADLARKGAGPLPALRVEPPVLRPFPWSRGAAVKEAMKAAALAAARPAAPSDTSMAPGQMRLYSYVAIKAQLLEHAGDEQRVLDKLGLPDFAATDASWQVILQGDPALARDYRRLLDAQRAKVRSASVKLGGTALALDVPRGPALPFVEGETAAAVAAAMLAEVSVARPPRSNLGGTALTVDVPKAAALPFPGAAAPAPPQAAAPAPPAPAAPRNKLAGTSLAVDVPRGPALPFAPSLSAARPAAPPAPPPRAPLPSAPLPPAPLAPPPLTLEQHASLSCEIAEAPERALQTLARYQITPAEKQAADQHFTERFARDPAARAAWDGAYRTYREWWRASRLSR